jgi:hypothetical protein
MRQTWLFVVVVVTVVLTILFVVVHCLLFAVSIGCFTFNFFKKIERTYDGRLQSLIDRIDSNVSFLKKKIKKSQ